MLSPLVMVDLAAVVYKVQLLHQEGLETHLQLLHRKAMTVAQDLDKMNPMEAAAVVAQAASGPMEPAMRAVTEVMVQVRR